MKGMCKHTTMSRISWARQDNRACEVSPMMQRMAVLARKKPCTQHDFQNVYCRGLFLVTLNGVSCLLNLSIYALSYLTTLLRAAAVMQTALSLPMNIDATRTEAVIGNPHLPTIWRMLLEILCGA